MSNDLLTLITWEAAFVVGLLTIVGVIWRTWIRPNRDQMVKMEKRQERIQEQIRNILERLDRHEEHHQRREEKLDNTISKLYEKVNSIAVMMESKADK